MTLDIHEVSKQAGTWPCCLATCTSFRMSDFVYVFWFSKQVGLFRFTFFTNII